LAEGVFGWFEKLLRGNPKAIDAALLSPDSLSSLRLDGGVDADFSAEFTTEQHFFQRGWRTT
jgi:hypothetical protein